MTALVVQGDARRLPLPDTCVDLIVTSPPYFALRSYTDAGRHYDGQIGSEATPAEYLDALWACTRDWIRVLKPEGSIFVNLGDKYSGGKGGYLVEGGGYDLPPPRNISVPGFRPKTLLGIPWRYAIGCIDQLGLILRAEIIWSKPNGLPESVTDRVRRSHEQWFWFQQESGDAMVSSSEGFPLCSLCGRPPDAKASLVARLHELEAGIEDAGLPDEIGPDQWIESEDSRRSEHPHVIGSLSSAVPPSVPIEGDRVEDSIDLLDNGSIPVVDGQSQVRALSAAVAEGDAALAVDDASEPSEVCRCGHPLIVSDETWIPQSIAADVMDLVAAGELDAKVAADFFRGGYPISHSAWFHFVKQPRYYSAVDEIREGYAPDTAKRYAAGYNARALDSARPSVGTKLGGDTYSQNALGKLPGSVWSIPSEPLTVPDKLGVDHFAAFPTELPRRLILGWSPPGVCTACGQGRRPVAVHEGLGVIVKGNRRHVPGYTDPNRRADARRDVVTTITGYACACTPYTDHPGSGEPSGPYGRHAAAVEAGTYENVGAGWGGKSGLGDRPRAGPWREYHFDRWAPPPTGPAVVLDPFGGTGTTALVAHALGRVGITVDMSGDYARLARWRTTDRGELAKAMRVPKPAPIPDGQMEMFA